MKFNGYKNGREEAVLIGLYPNSPLFPIFKPALKFIEIL